MLVYLAWDAAHWYDDEQIAWNTGRGARLRGHARAQAAVCTWWKALDRERRARTRQPWAGGDSRRANAASDLRGSDDPSRRHHIAAHSRVGTRQVARTQRINAAQMASARRPFGSERATLDCARVDRIGPRSIPLRPPSSRACRLPRSISGSARRTGEPRG